MSDKDLTITYEDDCRRVLLAGRLDSVTAKAFSDEVPTRCSGEVLVDLSGLRYISSAGIRALVLVDRTVRVRLTGATGLVAEVLEISGMDKVLG